MAKQLCEAIKELRQLVAELKELPRHHVVEPEKNMNYLMVKVGEIEKLTMRADAIFDAVNESLPEYFRKSN